MNRRAAALGAALLLGAGGCMPWAIGQTAETLPPRRVQLGAGATALIEPSEPASLLPVPQASARLGVAEGVDAGASYVFPLTGYADVKVRLARGAAGSVAATAGAGVHAVPLALGETVSTPFLGAGVLASTPPGAERVWFGGVRGFLPFHAGEDPAAVLWIAASVGTEWRRSRLTLAPEAGLVTSVLRPADVLLTVGASARWSFR